MLLGEYEAPWGGYEAAMRRPEAADEAAFAQPYIEHLSKILDSDFLEFQIDSELNEKGLNCQAS